MEKDYSTDWVKKCHKLNIEALEVARSYAYSQAIQQIRDRALFASDFHEGETCVKLSDLNEILDKLDIENGVDHE